MVMCCDSEGPLGSYQDVGLSRGYPRWIRNAAICPSATTKGGSDRGQDGLLFRWSALMKVLQREGGADSQEPVAKCLPDVVMTSRGAAGHVGGFLMTTRTRGCGIRVGSTGS